MLGADILNFQEFITKLNCLQAAESSEKILALWTEVVTMVIEPAEDEGY